MKKSDYLLRYVKLAPLQIALIRAEEAYVMAKTKMHKPILDIGASDGIFGEVLFNNQKGVIDYGIDIDKLALDFCRKRKTYQKVLLVDARNLPFPDDFFQTVISNQSLEHIQKVDRVIKEVTRVIKSRGEFIFLVPTIYLDDYWLTSAIFKIIGFKDFAKKIHDARNKFFKHHNLWTIAKWKKLLEKNSFKLKNYCYVGSKKNYFISELLWPARIPSYLFSRIFHRNLYFPKVLSNLLARMMVKIVNSKENKITVNGPTMLIIAQKV